MNLYEYVDHPRSAQHPVKGAEQKEITLNQFIERLKLAYQTGAGVSVNPENCMRSPTVHSIVTAISRRIAISPVGVFQVTVRNGREFKERQRSHPLEMLLAKPNEWQDRNAYFLDAASALVRYGVYYSHKARGRTDMEGRRGPTRILTPLVSDSVRVKPQEADPVFEVNFADGTFDTFDRQDIHWVRSGARDFRQADSPIMDVRESIALEIAAEQFGASFFGNGAIPLAYFKFMEGHLGFKDQADEDAFIDSFQEAFSKGNKFRGMLVPKGMEVELKDIDHEKTQFNQTMQAIRNRIAGAFGVPPHLVGDLERATFNNVEQQDKDFTINVILPYVRMFEAAMERDFLTAEQRRDGYVVRFDLNEVMRADFKSRQEGLKIQREAGAINANEWRAIEGRNPISEEDGGEDYIRPMNFQTPAQAEQAAEAPAAPNNPFEGEEDDD